MYLSEGVKLGQVGILKSVNEYVLLVEETLKVELLDLGGGLGGSSILVGGVVLVVFFCGERERCFFKMRFHTYF